MNNSEIFHFMDWFMTNPFNTSWLAPFSGHDTVSRAVAILISGCCASHHCTKSNLDILLSSLLQVLNHCQITNIYNLQKIVFIQNHMNLMYLFKITWTSWVIVYWNPAYPFMIKWLDKEFKQNINHLNLSESIIPLHSEKVVIFIDSLFWYS